MATGGCTQSGESESSDLAPPSPQKRRQPDSATTVIRVAAGEVPGAAAVAVPEGEVVARAVEVPAVVVDPEGEVVALVVAAAVEAVGKVVVEAVVWG